MNKINSLCLMYHDVFVKHKSESGFNGSSADTYKIGLADFENQIKLISNWITRNNPNNYDVRLTFDDGGSSFYYNIASVLEKFSIRGYFFIATKYIGTVGFLTESQIRDLESRGHIIGGHSHTHRQMMHTLSSSELIEDWTTCKEKLSVILGHDVTTCSLPCGFKNKAMLDILVNLGFKEIYTSDANCTISHYKSADLYGRYGVKDGMSSEYILSIVHSPIVRLKIKIRKVALGFAKQLLGKFYIRIRERIVKQKYSINKKIN